MNSNINKILADIDKKKAELKIEYLKLVIKYGFTFKWHKIVFNSDIIKKNKQKKKSIFYTLSKIKPRELIGIPFTFIMFFPALFLDIMLLIYQNIVFRVYWIPLVERKEYIDYDKNKLDYLNFIQKINCFYCSYVNWLFAFAVEVWWRTEKYWCPIKHAKKLVWWHKWEKSFADYGDIKWFEDALINRKKY